MNRSELEPALMMTSHQNAARPVRPGEQHCLSFSDEDVRPNDHQGPIVECNSQPGHAGDHAYWVHGKPLRTWSAKG